MAPASADTCHPALESWVRSAHAPLTDFPIQNLPFGVIRPRHVSTPWRIAVAIGTMAIDLRAAVDAGLLTELDPVVRNALRQASLNALFALGPPAMSAARAAVQRVLSVEAPRAARDRAAACLLDLASVEHGMPAAIRGFTDFFASHHHASNVARLRNPTAQLADNYAPAPLAYNARASTIVASGTPILRPSGPRRGGDQAVFAPTARLDYEAELGLFVGSPTDIGMPVPIADARRHLIGVCLLNDWSARDIQAFEAQPLGPFLSKSFATSISPWVVTLDALEPFRVPAQARPVGMASPLPHLVDVGDQQRGAWGIALDVLLSSRTMREMDMAPVVLAATDARWLLWTPAQLVAHHTSNGCNLETADLLGSGTISGAAPGTFGSLLEVTRGGREPLTLPTGETRTYLDDGDEVTLRGYCRAPGAVRIGFGECVGLVLPSRQPHNL